MIIKDNLLKRIRERRISLSMVMTGLVVCIVLAACIIAVTIFAYYYVNSTEQNAITNSDQAVSQVENMITNYTEDISGMMEMVQQSVKKTEEERNDFFENLF